MAGPCNVATGAEKGLFDVIIRRHPLKDQIPPPVPQQFNPGAGVAGCPPGVRLGARAHSHTLPAHESHQREENQVARPTPPCPGATNVASGEEFNIILALCYTFCNIQLAV